MLRQLTLLVVVFLCGSIINALPVDVEPAHPKNVDIQKSADSADDLESAASSWGGYGIRGWFGPSYYGGSYGGRGHYGSGWGSGWGNNHGSGWGGSGNWGWGNQGWGNGWGNQGYGGGWRRHGYGSGWNGGNGGYW